ncbi:fimbria/pilus outer membrane usher protein [Citrobacter amalonaticus]|uniref:fimbria/pilus outer membrane usher protein n=1 Tax=Citrobacter amalonaticus TaxID=35703 RepID=UPI00300CB6A4
MITGSNKLKSSSEQAKLWKSKNSKLTCPKSNLKLAYVAIIMILGFLSRNSKATETFNINALEIDNPLSTPVDLSQFSENGQQSPGIYRVDVYLNGEIKTTEDIKFIFNSKKELTPELTPKMLEDWGVRISNSKELSALPVNEIITDLSKYFPQAETNFDFSRLTLNISVPQAAMMNIAQGSIDPQYWDEGLTALLLNYSFTGANSKVKAGNIKDDSYFLNLHSGLNLAEWRLRNYSTWSYNNHSGTEDKVTRSWDSINTYVERSLPSITGNFVGGDTYTPSDIFDSIQFRGVQIASDDNMLPDSQKGFAPTIRGIASSNAQVTIKQNNSIIYQTYVSPGAFVINDLYPTAASGDLLVTIKEADGSERTFVQPFSNVPVMQRVGRLKYALSTGKYRSSDSHVSEPNFAQATLLYGLTTNVTVYAGIQAAEKYQAVATGVGLGMGEAGAVSVDVTQAHVKYSINDTEKEKQGQSYRFQYSKDIAATDSTVTLAGYRYSTKGYYSFNEAMSLNNDDDDDFYNFRNNKRSKFQIDLSQNLMGGDWGSFSISGYQQDYWKSGDHERNFTLGYSNSWNSISWTLSYSYSQFAGSDADDNKMYALSVSMPLGRWLPGGYISNSTTHDSQGRTYNQTSVSGTMLERNNLSYNISQGYGNQGEGNSGAISSDYRGAYGEVSTGYNYDQTSHQINYGVDGAIIAHKNGITFGQPLSGDMTSVALVRAPGAANTVVQSNTGVSTDWRGYAIVPYLSPYRRSRIALDPETLDEDVDLKDNVTSVVPTAGAVVLADFKTNVGKRVLMQLKHGPQPVPFGAFVSLENDSENVGIVGDDGLVYLSGVPQQGKLMAQWGAKSNQQCLASFTLPDISEKNLVGIQQINVDCEAK